MKFIIEIELSTDAMQTTDDICGSLRDVASTVKSQKIVFEQRRSIHDNKGNIVGTWELKEETTVPCNDPKCSQAWAGEHNHGTPKN